MNWHQFGALVALGLAAIDGVFIALLARSRGGGPGSDTMYGLPIGGAVPFFETRAADGTPVSDLTVAGHFMLFVSNQCHSCRSIVNELVSTGERKQLVTVVVDAPLSTEANFVDQLSPVAPRDVIYDPARVISDRLAIPGVPFVYAIDMRGRIRAKRTAHTLNDVWHLAKFLRG